ncbi:MAG: MinD/ParA family protein [Mycobacteriaceae bacterium]|nr:MinD/ParA family protein [Mycobacteriaceae bacterium]
MTTSQGSDGHPTAAQKQTLPRPPSVDYIRTDNLDELPRKAAARGWRRRVYRATGGRINPGRSAHEQRQADLHRRAATLLRGNYRIGVLGKGGVGKTTVSAGIGSLLAEHRTEDRVVAIDADTGFGKLGLRVDPAAVDSYWELVTDAHLYTLSDVRSRLGINRSGLFVLPGDPTKAHPLDPVYREAVARLDPHFAVTIIDCGTTVESPLTRAVAADLDAAVVVATPWADGASIAHHTLHWLAEHGSENLLRRAIVVLNDTDGNSDRTTCAGIAESFTRTGLLVFDLPFDRRLHAGAVLDTTYGMSRHSRVRFLEIAAALAENFGDNTHRHRPPPR